MDIKAAERAGVILGEIKRIKEGVRLLNDKIDNLNRFTCQTDLFVYDHIHYAPDFSLSIYELLLNRLNSNIQRLEAELEQL